MSDGHGESKTSATLILVIGILLVGALIGIFFPSGIKKVSNTISGLNSKGFVKGQDVNPVENRETDAYYIKADIDKTVCGIKVFSPLPGQKVSFPLEVSGYVNGCSWAPFEGQIGTLDIRDGNQSLSPLIIIPVDGDNYTLPAYFKFKANINVMPGTQNGVLIFRNDDPSGDHPETFQIPISF